MFNLNESNRFVMSRTPVDLRKGVDSLCGAIRSCHLDPLNGDVYVFSNRSRTVLKLLHWERGGYTLYYKRLSMGRFVTIRNPPCFSIFRKFRPLSSKKSCST